ncbi:MAG: hypothetical protein LBL90_11630 [Prevotellaceae bacterium]|jgi:hypothetical protein|nr:hypothetical protein [Prevotellaceae bacterium]
MQNSAEINANRASIVIIKTIFPNLEKLEIEIKAGCRRQPAFIIFHDGKKDGTFEDIHERLRDKCRERQKSFGHPARDRSAAKA